MNQINPKKLLYSKWTAVKVINKERHFIISKLTFEENGDVAICEIEAILSKRTESIDWTSLKDNSQWIQGWK
ncbi:MAG: TIGR02450 family Trp-rich protein [Glaciecola sp.]